MFMGRMNGIYIDNAEPALISTTAKDIGYQIDVKGSVKLNKIVTSKSRVTVKEQMIHHNRLLFADTDGAQMIKRYLSKVKGINGVTIDENEIWNDINDALDYSMTPRYNKLQRG
jgi:RNase adaptor protein for sRNA GlmZ degradation